MRWIFEAQTAGAHRLGHATALGADGPALLSERDDDDSTPEFYQSAAERLDHLSWLEQEQAWLRRRGYTVDLKEVKAHRAKLSGLPPETVLTTAWTDQAAADLQRLQDAVIEELVARRAVVESCPTSNLRLSGLRDPMNHPLGRFLEAGLTVVVGADDPGVFATSLPDEEELLREVFGLGDPEIATLGIAAESSTAPHLARGKNVAPR